MQFKTAVTVHVQGQTTEVQTEASTVDIRELGVRWLPVVNDNLPPHQPVPVCVGHLINVAGICRANQLYADELGALRLARRLSSELASEIDGLIALRVADGAFRPQGLPEHVSFLHQRDDPEAFRSHLEQPAIAGLAYPGVMYESFVQGTMVHSSPDTTPHFIDNLSFHVLRKGKKVATVPCWVNRDGALNWTNDTPVTVHCVDLAQESAIVSHALQYLQYLVRAHGCTSLVIREVNPEQMTLYKQVATNQKFSAELFTRPYLNLALSPDELQKNIRKSYKSHVNWCKDNLSTEHLSAGSITQDTVNTCFAKLQSFHADNIRKFGDGMPGGLYMYFVRKCLQGQGEIAITRHQGEICGITISVDDGDDTYYAQAGSIQLEDGKTPGAYNVLDAAARAQQRGKRRYLMDRFTCPSVSVDWPRLQESSDHAMALRFFKRGFSDEMEKAYVYKILPPRIKAH